MPHFVTVIDRDGQLAAVFPFEESDHRYDCTKGKPLGTAAISKIHRRELMMAYAEALIDNKRGFCRFQSQIDKGKSLIEIQVIRFPKTTASALLLSRELPFSPHVKLTPRELQVIKLSAKDKSDEQIANSLKIARGTVSRHKQNIRDKIGVKEWSSAVLWAGNHGML